MKPERLLPPAGRRAATRPRVDRLFYLILLCLLGASSVSPAPAQTLADQWRDARYGLTLTLSADGAYVMEHAGGRSQGRYQVQGQALWMKDNAASSPVQYTLLQLTATELVIQDGNSVRLQMQRIASPPAAGTPPPPPPAPAGDARTSRVLARQGTLVLTGGHVDAGVGLIHFIIGHGIQATEYQELEAKSIEEFNQLPDKFLEQMNSLAQSLQRLRSLTDPVRIGLARQQLFAALFTATRQMQEFQKPLLVQVIDRYIKVLAYDPSTNLALTDRDAAGMVNYLAFMSDLAGQPVSLGEADRQAIAVDLAARFPAMPLEQKQLLCSASLLWELLDYNWQRMTPSQRQQARDRYQAARVQLAGGGPTPGGQAGSTGGPHQQLRDQQARQNCLKIMGDMNLNSHALSLNIIENMGGTGNYWQVTDVPY